MTQLSSSNSTLKANPVEMTAASVNYLVKKLPSGTAYCIAMVLIVMMTGRLVESKGSLARAVLPFGGGVKGYGIVYQRTGLVYGGYD